MKQFWAKFIQAGSVTMWFSAGIHIVLLLVLGLQKMDLSGLNYWDLLDFEKPFPILLTNPLLYWLGWLMYPLIISFFYWYLTFKPKSMLHQIFGDPNSPK